MTCHSREIIYYSRLRIKQFAPIISIRLSRYFLNIEITSQIIVPIDIEREKGKLLRDRYLHTVL